MSIYWSPLVNSIAGADFIYVELWAGAATFASNTSALIILPFGPDPYN